MAGLVRFFDTRDQHEDTKPVFSFRLDLETRKITERQIYNKKIGVAKIIDEFAEALDDRTIDRFRLHLSQAKQYGRKHYLDFLPEPVIDGVLDGDVMPYAGIFGSQDMSALGFQCNSNDYLVVDYYCMDPQYPCNDAHLQFIKVNHRRKAQDTLFSIVLALSNYQYTFEAIHCKPEKAEEPIKYFTRNKEMLKVLKHHYSEMKAASREIREKYGERLKQTQPKLVKIGRNDPCPCGSGKKYKHCCLKSTLRP